MVNDSDTQKISDNNESSGQTSSAEVSSANKEAEAVLEQPKSKIEGDVSPTTNNSDKTTPANESRYKITFKSLFGTTFFFVKNITTIYK